jgi:23S rRNA pseudouridine2605 synthase
MTKQIHPSAQPGVKNSNFSKNSVRINKFLAQAGFGSRRGVEELIINQKVRIKFAEDDFKIAKLGDRVNSETDIVEVNGVSVNDKDELVYFALNKPVGYTSSVREKCAEKLVVDLVPKKPKIYPVGRLDKNSRGLLILTNDGEFTNLLTHPKYQHKKEYEVKVSSKNENIKSNIGRLKRGMKLKEGTAKFDEFEITEINESKGLARLRVVIHQGWNRQIRRMCALVGLEVMDLKRTGIGKLKLGDIGEGNYREIEKKDVI